MPRHYMKVLFWFRKNTRSLERPGTLYCRVTVDKVEHNFATSIRLYKPEWNADRQEVRGRSENTKSANAHLERIKKELRNAFDELDLEGEYITPEKVVLRYEKPQARRQSLLVLREQYLQSRWMEAGAGLIKSSTVEADEVRLNRLEEWLQDTGKLEMRPQELDTHAVEQFVSWMRVTRRRSKNYALKITDSFYGLLKWCVRQKVISSNPMEEFSMAADKPGALVFLTPLELVKLWFYKFESDALRKIADLFLFQCFTGLAWQDLYNFRGSEHLAPQPSGVVMLLIERQKSETQAMIPMLHPALEILAKYGGERLPVPSNQYFNRTLKQIAYMLHWQKKLTTHVGRKTAGMILLQDGVSLTIVSRVLGHKSITVTQKHYAQVLSDTVAYEMGKVLGAETVGLHAVRRPFLTEFTEQLRAAG